MMTENTQSSTLAPGLSSLCRWLLAATGVLFVGVAALGVVVPGLPTTLFLILATWCFTRSCPWLERKLIQVPLFRPFLPYLQPGARLSRRARTGALAAMWTAIAVSTATLSAAGAASRSTLGLILVAGAIGSVAILKKGRARCPAPGAGRQVNQEQS